MNNPFFRCIGLLIATLLAVAIDDCTAATFPRQNLSSSQGYYEGLYMVVRDVDAAPLSDTRIGQIEASEILTREFYAASSGGTFDFHYAHILDVPLVLNDDGTRDGDWAGDAQSYVRTHYGIEPNDFHSKVYDLSATEPDPDQGWSGIAWGNSTALQEDITSNWGQIVVDHELGHRVGSPHSGAWRARNDNNFTPYVYDYDAETYVEYSADTDSAQAMPYGINYDEYGDPYTVMGNISRGQFSVREKLTNMDWLDSTQVPDLDQVGNGIYRIYAHDELQTTYNPRLDMYGVEETYASDKLYGLTFTQEGEEFNRNRGAFESTSNTITLEYRSGTDGLLFYFDNALLDVNPEGGTDRNNRERDLEVGLSLRQLDLGVSIYESSGDGDDFLSHNPPAPSAPWELLPEWYEFLVLGLGSDETGSYIDLRVATVDYVLENSLAGDLTGDGLLDRADWLTLVANIHTDVSDLTKTERYLHGDLNFDGFSNYDDFVQFKQLYTDAYGASAFTEMMRVPEPHAGLLIVGMIVAARTLGFLRSR